MLGMYAYLFWFSEIEAKQGMLQYENVLISGGVPRKKN